jgi:hypothetical protein
LRPFGLQCGDTDTLPSAPYTPQHVRYFGGESKRTHSENLYWDLSFRLPARSCMFNT